MLPYLVLTAGMIARTIVMIGLDIRWRQLLTIAACVGFGFLMVLETTDDGNPPWWPMLPIGYAMVAVFAFKRYMLQPLTEGTLLLYGLLGTYVFFIFIDGLSVADSVVATAISDYITVGQTFLSCFALFLLVYLVIATVVVLTRIRSSDFFCGLYMVLFLVMNVWLSIVVALTTFVQIESLWEMAVIGFVYLPLLANIFYVLFFIPIPLSKHQSFAERMRQIAVHSHDLREQYFDIDAHYWILLGNVGVGVGAMLLHGTGLLSLPITISLAVTAGALLNEATLQQRIIPHIHVGQP